MIYKKGKWQASYKDTWCLETTLRPIIGAAIKRYIEEVEKGESYPVVMYGKTGMEDVRCFTQATDEQSLQARSKWLNILYKIDKAFNSKEPNIMKYDFCIDILPSEDNTVDSKLKYMDIKVSNEEERNRYQTDMDEYNAMLEEGYMLFGKYLRHLWN